MIVISQHVAVPDGEFKTTAIRAQGAGGRHVSKTSAAIRLRFDIRASSLPEYYEEHLLAADHHLISSDGAIVIKIQEYHNRELNRETALARLMAVIKGLTAEQKTRQPTWPTHTSKERRLASKAQKSNMKAMRDKVHNGQE